MNNIIKISNTNIKIIIKEVIFVAKKGMKRPSPTENQHQENKKQKKENHEPVVPETK